MTTRGEVYKAVNGERDYQEALIKKHGPQRDSEEFARNHSIDSYLVFMEDYMSELKKVRAREWGAGEARGLDTMRKIVALGVACMEDHGAPIRKVENGKNRC